QPTDIEMRDVCFVKGGRVRPCVVLTFIKGDEFMCNNEIVVNTDALMMYLSRLESGKLDHIPPEVAIEGLHDCEELSKVSLRIPSEDEEIFVSTKYRDPSHPSREYRYYTGEAETDNIISNNSRTDAMQSTTWTAFNFEDINNSLITSVNRANRGEVNPVGPFEAVVRGLDMEAIKEADRGQFDNPAIRQQAAPKIIEDSEGERPVLGSIDANKEEGL
ncbi:MAG: hypothetical protein K2F99_03030, partial [Muribaculaceae bacterium]|nr:hypothetical protein [Muribaculaceae bacterium]